MGTTTDIELGTVLRAVTPGVLSSREFYELPPTDLLLCVPLETAIVVPGPIDISRLKSALQSALSYFPLFAGRLERCGNAWRVHLNNKGALFDACVSSSPAPPVAPDAPVVQAPFNLVRHLDHASLSGTSDSPLLRVTLTLGPDSRWSVVGFSAAHVAGDGWIAAAFMRAVSRLYLGLDLEPDQHICYDYRLPAPIASHPDDTIPTPWVDNFLHMSIAERKERPATIRIDLRMSAAQLSELRDGVMALRPVDDLYLRLSKQDCLISVLGLALSRALNSFGEVPISRATVAFNYRGVGSVPPTLAGNVLVQAVADVPPHISSDATAPMLPYAYALAASIRRAFRLCRDPQYTLANAAICGKKFARAATTTPPMLLDFAPRPGVLNVNSSRPFAWTSAHFGFKGQARFFHTTSDAPRYAKIFTPNPTPLPDGSWRTNDGGAEVVLYVEPHLRSSFVQGLSAVVRELGVQGEVEFVAA
ncbi:hypothetical protein AURDEDRAFT_165359 [Auricularia subglabra TFB-10046 SS5]|nr:hypothetical protein AURDEDRAFT_165359 [Auricularia subglabra TFB-10046 SS5]